VDPASSAAQTLTFLFTDIEGSTAMLQRLGGAYAEVLADGADPVRSARRSTPSTPPAGR
jgi:class 3 adenylate cyclase